MNDTIRCPRCHGRRKMWKMRNCYSMIDVGGIEVTCPMCLGEGEVKSLQEALTEVKEKISDNEPKKEKRKYEKKSLSSFPIHPDQKSLNVETGAIE